MRHSLYRYYDDRKWADAFLDGELLLRPLSYFRDYEDAETRGDKDEGSSIYRPHDGLVINNLTQGKLLTLSNHSFVSTARLDEIFVFCTSRFESDECRARFNSVACVEILQIKELCTRIQSALPQAATFFAKQVEYYRPNDNCTPRWALPEKIATAKLASYAWQNEYRFVFCLTEALAFENVSLKLMANNDPKSAKQDHHQHHLLRVGSLRDICRLRLPCSP